jgi:hypothetical protein
MDALLKEHEWEEKHEEEEGDESFRAVSTSDWSYTHNDKA